MRQFKVIVEKHADGYVAYLLGLNGVVIGEGDSHEEALADLKSAIIFHTQTFVPQDLTLDETALLSEPALAEDWNRPEEDAAWAHLQPA